MALLRTLAATMAAALALAGGAAAAHARLVSSNPPDGARLSAPPAQALLTFSEPLTLAFSGLSLEGPGTARRVLGDLRLQTPRTLAAALPKDLGDGAYVLAWKAVSTDSHRTEGRVRFVLRRP